MDVLNSVILGCLIFPSLLLGFAWTRGNRRPIEFSALTLSAVLFCSAMIHSAKVVLLGRDYSNRLYGTIGTNLLVVVILGFYLGFTGRRAAAVAALILAVGWFLMAGINSVV